MTLPGKLCVGIIEEDNPLKSYFRFRPLLVEENGEYREFDAGEDYPENGCIRIVPDKNESSRFKARMRRLSGYCVVDLRGHSDENDKIRANKNYRGDENETNAYIIYSDVVREPEPGMLAEAIPNELSGDSDKLAMQIKPPRTRRVIISTGGEPVIWKVEPLAEPEGAISLSRTQDGIDEAGSARFDISLSDIEKLSFYIARPGGALWIEEAPVDAPEEEREQTEEKPWIHRDMSVAATPVNANLAPRDMAREMQRGINPTRGRSIQEIIDDKWRHSRMDQLGHPVGGEMHGIPLTSPIEAAVEALRGAWEHFDAREGLLRAIAGIGGLGESLCGGRDEAVKRDMRQTREEYEKRVAELRAELETLEAERESRLDELKKQIIASLDSEIKEREERVKTLENQAAELRARADEATAIAEAAERSLDEMTNITIERKLAEFAITSRASDLLTRIRRGAAAKPQRERLKRLDEVSVSELSSRVRAVFARAGFDITYDESVNMLACLSLGSHVLITGPTGCGKTACARLLACALGLSAEGRMVAAVLPDGGCYSAPEELEQPSELPLMAFYDDVNVNPEICETLISIYENRDDVKLVMTAQDSGTGKPIPARVLDRSFTIRLKLDDTHISWATLMNGAKPSAEVITMRALKALFKPDEKNIAPQVAARMGKLRADLNRYGVSLSRRTIGELWRYCASVTPLLKKTPLETLDLAFAQRALPAVISSAGVEALHYLPEILEGMPASRELLTQPLAIEI